MCRWRLKLNCIFVGVCVGGGGGGYSIYTCTVRKITSCISPSVWQPYTFIYVQYFTQWFCILYTTHRKEQILRKGVCPHSSFWIILHWVSHDKPFGACKRSCFIACCVWNHSIWTHHGAVYLFFFNLQVFYTHDELEGLHTPAASRIRGARIWNVRIKTLHAGRDAYLWQKHIKRFDNKLCVHSPTK